MRIGTASLWAWPLKTNDFETSNVSARRLAPINSGSDPTVLRRISYETYRCIGCADGGRRGFAFILRLQG
jgi:hypothetical protein